MTTTSPCAADPMTLWFDRPAEVFHEACPLGNGRLGALLGPVTASDINWALFNWVSEMKACCIGSGISPTNPETMS